MIFEFCYCLVMNCFKAYLVLNFSLKFTKSNLVYIGENILKKTKSEILSYDYFHGDTKKELNFLSYCFKTCLNRQAITKL